MTDPDTPGPAAADPAALIAARLDELWRTNRPTILERMTVLHASVGALTRNPADAKARSQGREAAHKLAGILGVFGLPHGSGLASQIEDLLIEEKTSHTAGRESAGTPLTAEKLAILRTRIAELDAVIASKPAK